MNLFYPQFCCYSVSLNPQQTCLGLGNCSRSYNIPGKDGHIKLPNEHLRKENDTEFSLLDPMMTIGRWREKSGTCSHRRNIELLLIMPWQQCVWFLDKHQPHRFKFPVGMLGAHLEILSRIEMPILEGCQHDRNILLTQKGTLENAIFQETVNDWNWS